ncbi:MAG: hypothetical protein ACQEQV_08345 [Fibrobacterota bacterium]
MVKRIVLLALVAATLSAGEDYAFPSVNPPGGKRVEDVNQYISIIWDDNAYSGKAGTNYEGHPGIESFSDQSWVNGIRDEGGWKTSDNKNELNLEEGDMGMSWASQTLAGRTPLAYTQWDKTGAYSPQVPDTVVHNDSVWACVDWPISTGEDTVEMTTSEGVDTTIIQKVYAEPAILDTSAGNTFTVEEWNGTEYVEKELTWDEMDQSTKSDIREQYKAWSFVEAVASGLSRTNPDGSPILFTFNVISGLMVPTWPVDWQARESKYGYYVPNEAYYPDDYNPANTHSKIAASWGREMPIYTSKNQDTVFIKGYINAAFNDALETGHEIGNHTIDHMESNSPLPNKKGEPIASMPGASGEAYMDGFARWGGDGYDTSKIDYLPWGEEFNEAEQYGQKDGNIWQYMGWTAYAGKYISKEAWKGAVKLGEEELEAGLGISVASGDVNSFRAPRLEVNSELYYALDELGYQYDCGLEEGYEEHRDGTNFLWPYTMDNGSPNVNHQRLIGVDVTIDSTPTGLWQVPVNVFVVPEEYRREVWDNHKQINDNALDGGDIGAYEDWADAGKITGFDFNLYIMWGMTKEAWLATVKNTTRLRLEGNKAPIHYGAHTDYYTPIYDNATLQNDVNKNSYGLNVTEGWNTWDDRTSSMEEYIDWAIDTGCYVVTGHELIERIKDMQKDEQFGEAKSLSNAAWNFYKNDALNSSANTESFTGDIDNAQVSVDKAAGENVPTCGYGYYFSAGTMSKLDHISLEYQTTAPLTIRLLTSSGESREVMLGHVGGGSLRTSGRIPVSAFEQNQYSGIMGYQEDMINTEEITGIEIEVMTDELEQEEHSFTVKNFTAYTGADLVGTVENATTDDVNTVNVKQLSQGKLSLMVGSSGTYDIALVSAKGRLIRNLKNRNLAAGLNTVDFGGLSRGVYFVRVASDEVNRTVKTFAQ